MRSVKKISGDLLLYFYAVQRKRGIANGDIIRFSHFGDGEITELNCDESLKKAVMKISNASLSDAFNAFSYLKEKGFIDSKWSPDSGGDNIFNLRVSAYGIDIVEGIERGPEERNQFNLTFNFKLADNIKVESLIKNELQSLVKASLI